LRIPFQWNAANFAWESNPFPNQSITPFTIFLPVSGSVGSPIFIEAPTIYFSQTLLGKENISIF